MTHRSPKRSLSRERTGTFLSSKKNSTLRCVGMRMCKRMRLCSVMLEQNSQYEFAESYGHTTEVDPTQDGTGLFCDVQEVPIQIHEMYVSSRSWSPCFPRRIASILLWHTNCWKPGLNKRTDLFCFWELISPREGYVSTGSTLLEGGRSNGTELWGCIRGRRCRRGGTVSTPVEFVVDNNLMEFLEMWIFLHMHVNIAVYIIRPA